MLRWLQYHIRKKNNDRVSIPVNNQLVEVGTDAIIHDANNSLEQETICLMGADTQSGLREIQVQRPRQEGDGVLATPEVECLQYSSERPVQCLALDALVDLENVAFNSSSHHSSNRKNEDDSVNTHHHHPLENSNASTILHSVEDTCTSIDQDSFIPLNQRESFATLPRYQNSSDRTQEYKKNTICSPKEQNAGLPSLLENQSSVLEQEHREDVSCQLEKYKSALSSQKYAENFFIPQTHKTDAFNSKKGVENITHVQEKQVCADIKGTSSSQEHEEDRISPMKYIKDISSQKHTKEIKSPQEFIESSTIKQNPVKSIHQEPNKTPLSPEKHVEDYVGTMEHKENVSNLHTHCISNTQAPSVSNSPEHDQCQYFTQSYAESISKLGSSQSLTLPKIGTTIEPSQNSLDPSENDCKEFSDMLEIRKNIELENATSQEPEPSCEYTSEANFIPVDELDFSHVQQEEEFACINEKLNVDENTTQGRVTESSDQVNEYVPRVCLEKDFSSESDKVLDKMRKSDVEPVMKVDRFSQTQTMKYQCSNSYCYPQACLYNQKGKKCTILGEHFILTYLMEAPVVVKTSIENTDRGPLGCVIVWCSGKAIQFGDLPDGTEIYFDAVVSSKAPNFVAIVMWQNEKPTHSVEPFCNCYVIVEQIRNCPVRLVSFGKENGVVSAHIYGKTVKVFFSKSVVYIDEHNIQNSSDIKKMSMPSKTPYADVVKLMTIDQANKITYEFMCSCIWLGCKPRQMNPLTVYDPLKLYRKSTGYFAVANKQLILLCDLDASLEIEGTTYKITFEDGGQFHELPCNKKDIFCSNQRIVPVCGRVKVHLRKTRAKGTYAWMILMVQLEPSLLLEATVNGSLPHQTLDANIAASPPHVFSAEESPVLNVISTKSLCKSEILKDITDFGQISNTFTENDVEPKLPYKPATQSARFVTKEIKSEYGETTVTSNEMVPSISEMFPLSMCKGESFKISSESSCISEMHEDSSNLKKKSQEAASNVEEQIFKGRYSVHGESVAFHSDHAPLMLIKNGSGLLKNLGKVFIIQTSLEEKVVHIEMGKAPWIAFENGKSKRCQTPMSDLPVGFDAHFVDIPLVGPVGHILALWNGKKPLKASLMNCTYYYDVPGVYQGSDEKGCFKFMVWLEGKITCITTPSSSLIFEASGEQCASLTVLSHVFLHLSLTRDIWTLILVVLQPKHTDAHITNKAKSRSLESLSVMKSKVSKTSHLTLQTMACHNHMSAAPKTSHASQVLTPYLKNLCGIMTQEAGRRVVHTHFKDIPLSVEISDNCNVDVDAVAVNVRQISLGTTLHFDAFCEDTNNSRYRAVVVWLKRKSPRLVSHWGCIYHYYVRGRCLNSDENEVALELMIDNQLEHVVCSTACIIMPDGTVLAQEYLTADMLIHANLMQQNQNFSINDFIYIDKVAGQTQPPSTIYQRLPEEIGTLTMNFTKKIVTKKSGLQELPTLLGELDDKCVHLQPSRQKSMAVDKKEIDVATPDSEIKQNVYDIVKGTVTHLQHDTYIFSDDKENFKIEIDPWEIAVDLQARQTRAGEFYLVYHKKSKVGMCGWYQHQTRQVYLQCGMIAHAHNPAINLITLALPDRSSLYNFLWDNELIVTGTKLCRHVEVKSGKRVHPIIEDIKPILINGCVVSHRIVFMTTIKEIAGVCLNFLKHSIFASQEKEISRNQPIVKVNHLLSIDSSRPYEDSRRDDCEDKGVASLLYERDTDLLLKQQVKNEPEVLDKTIECLNTSESHSCSETSVLQSQVNQPPDSYKGNIDGEGEALRDLICTKHPCLADKTNLMQFVTLYGEILPGDSGTSLFCSRKLPSPILLPHNLPHRDSDVRDGKEKGFMLLRKMCAKESGIIDHEPVTFWPENRKCDPYIVVTYKISYKNNFLSIIDAADGKEKCYFCDYNIVFSRKNQHDISEVISHSKSGKVQALYAVVDDIPPLQIHEHYVEGNVLLISTSKNVAVSSIDVFIGCCYEEELLFQELNKPILHLLHQYKMRIDRALNCKRGSTYYCSPRQDIFDPSMEVVGGFLQGHMDDFAIITYGKKKNVAVCHFSNIYYQGENIESLATIPKHLWKNLRAILLPLDSVLLADKWEIKAVAVVAWCCGGPRVFAVHQCHYHVPTLYVPFQNTKEIQNTGPTNLLQSLGNSIHSLDCCAGTVMSMTELESWQCQAGSTIFAFHESILKSCGLHEMSGKVVRVNRSVALFTSSENEMVTCKIPNIFIKGKRCASVKNVISVMDKTFTLVAVKCFSTYLRKNIQKEVIIAFTGSLKQIGIHICGKHVCILESELHKEEIAIAEEVFHDIEVLCEQSAQCSDYYLSKLEVRTLVPSYSTRTTKHTLCCGYITDINMECPDQLKVTIKKGPKSLSLPVSHSRLLGLNKELSLQQSVGRPLKVILATDIRNEMEDDRILMGWGNVSESDQSQYSSQEADLSFTTAKLKFPCCARGFVVKEFQSLYNCDMFEVKSLCKLKNVDEESCKGFFHYWLSERLLPCRIQSIIGWPEVKAQEDFWNVLVPKNPEAGKEKAEGVAAWRGDRDSLVVEVCDVHGTHGLNVASGKERITHNKYISVPAKRERCNSEQSSSHPTSQGLKSFSRHRLSSETIDLNSSIGINLRQINSFEENDLELSRSYPRMCDHSFENGLQENKENTSYPSSGKENMSYPSSGTEHFSRDHPLFTSSLYGEDKESVISLENEENISSTVRPTLTTIKSSSFHYMDHHRGLIVDILSHSVALVRQERLYINQMKPKESLKQLCDTVSHGIITAVVVPLGYPDTLHETKITYEAIVAWLGARPPGVGSMVKNISTILHQQENLLQDMSKATRPPDCNENFCKHDISINRNDEVPSVTLKIRLRKIETVSACSVKSYADHCGILMSSKEPILFDRKLLNVVLHTESASGTLHPDSLMNTLKASILQLEQPIKLLSFEVKKIAVMIWADRKPELDADFIEKSLNLYKMKWNVEFIGSVDQLEMDESARGLQKNRIPSGVRRAPSFQASPNECIASEDFKEIFVFCSPIAEDKLCTVVSIEDEFVVLRLKESKILALWEDVWCHKKTIKMGMQLQAVCAKFSESLSFLTHSFEYFAVMVYMCDEEPEESSTIKLRWEAGTTEKFLQIRSHLDSKMTMNLQVKVHTPMNTQSRPTNSNLQSLPRLQGPVEDSAVADEYDLLKLMDECAILKVKKKITREEIKVFFQRNIVLINNETVSKQEWKETLGMVSQQKQPWQWRGERLSLQERESVMRATGEDADYKAMLLWCKTCTSTLSAQTDAKTLPDNSFTSDENNCTNRTCKEEIQHFLERSLEIPTVEDFQPLSAAPQLSSAALQPSSVCGCVELNSSNYSLHSKTETEGNLMCEKDSQSSLSFHNPHRGSLWAARPTLRIILGEQETLSIGIVKCYSDDYCILDSAEGPVLFDRKLVDVIQQKETASGTHGFEHNMGDLKALTFKLEQPVKVLGCEIRKITVAIWNGEEPEIDNSQIHKSIDVYRLNWIVVCRHNMSALPKSTMCKPRTCRTFYVTSFQDQGLSRYPEIPYYCSQECCVRLHEAILVLSDHVLLKHKDNVVLAVIDDVKCSESYLKKGKYFWVVSVKLTEPFIYCSHLVTCFALLVYSEEMEPSDTAAIKLSWHKGEIEKVTTFERKVSCGFAKVNIRIQVDRLADMKPYSMGRLWPLTPDRPEGDMIFAVECEVLKLMKNCGLLKARGRITSKGNEIIIFFSKDAVLINSKGLSRHATFVAEMLPLTNQVWRCSGKRLTPQERENVRMTTDNSAQYRAQLIWCEVCTPSVQVTHTAGSDDAIKAIESNAQTPETLRQSEAANAWQDARVGHLAEVFRTVAQVALEDKQLKYVAREKCFLYGVCLAKVELWHVFHIDLNVNYELTADKKEVKMVWVGGANPLDSILLLNTLREWCLVHNVAPPASTILQMEAGWLPSDLTPTAASDEDIKVVEVPAPACGFISSQDHMSVDGFND